MNTLRADHLNRVVLQLPDRLLKLCQKHGPKLVVAGGCIRDPFHVKVPSDFDVFVASAAFAEQLAGGDAYDSGHAFVDEKTQYIYTLGDDPAKVIAAFDFTCCKAAVWWNGAAWQSLHSSTFYLDLIAKKLIYSRRTAEGRVTSIVRAMRLCSRGYTIDKPNIQRLLEDVVAQEPDIAAAMKVAVSG